MASGLFTLELGMGVGCASAGGAGLAVTWAPGAVLASSGVTWGGACLAARPLRVHGLVERWRKGG